MNEDKFGKLLNRIIITPKRLLSEKYNDRLEKSTIYNNLLRGLNKKDYSFNDVFGDIIFTKEKMRDLYVSQRANPFFYLSEKNDKIPVSMNTVLKEIYTDNYVVFKDNNDKWHKSYSTNIEEIKSFIHQRSSIGKPEASLEHQLDVIYPSSHCRIERLLIIIGGIGCGKTTFIAKYLDLYKNHSGLYIDFNFINTEANFDENSLYKSLYKKIKLKEIGRIGQTDFRKEVFAQKIDENIGFFTNDDNSINERLLKDKLQEWFEDKEIFVTSYLYYISSEENFILIFDNIDLHSNKNQNRLYEFSKTLIDEIATLKIIITMREYSYGSIQQQYHGTLVNQPILHLTTPDVKSIVSERIKKIIDIIGSNKIQIQIDNPTSNSKNFILTTSDTLSLVNNLLLPITLPKSLFFLVSISNNSIKLLLSNIVKFISSPYLMNTKFATNILKESVLNDYKGAKISFDEFLQIMLLDTYQYYEERLHPNSIISIINLYKTDISNCGNRCFLTLRIIDYTLKHWKNEINIQKKNLIKTISNGLCIDKDKVNGCFENLMKSGTLESPDGLIKSDTKNIDNVITVDLDDESLIFPTRKAWYYSHRLSKFLTYIRLIQNDLYLDYNHNESSFSDRLDSKEIRNYLLFIDWIRRIEKNEVAQLDEKNRADYLQILGENPLCLKVLKSLITRLIELKNNNFINILIIKETELELKELYAIIKSNIKSNKILPETDEEYIKQIDIKMKSLLKP